MEFDEAHLLDDGAHGCLDRALPLLIEHGTCDEVFEEDDTIDGALVLLAMAWKSPRSPYSCLWSPPLTMSLEILMT